MPGTGTKPDITTSNPPPARLLDLTRLASRAGRRLTGVDRVEFAYARALTRQPQPCFGLVRSSFGYILVRPELLWPVVQRICHGKRRAPDLLSRLSRGKTRAQREAETELRGCALARCRPRKLAHMLQAHLPSGFAYLNVGHSNLSSVTFDAVRGAGGRSTVMVHDVIPLDFPQFQRSGTPERFAEKMQTVRQHVDLILYNSQDTQRRAEAALSQWGSVPAGIVSYLGTEAPAPMMQITAKNLPPESPYFIAVGTIEPRKNIGFLLDLWDQMDPKTASRLLICGTRGWNNEAVFKRLDALPQGGAVSEHGGLDDATLTALIAGSQGLLFPSYAEGFGLPAVEAARLGVPVLCNTLDVYRETLGDIPIYASIKDPYLWIKHIEELGKTTPGTQAKADLDALTWDEHFKTVLSMT